MAQLKDTTIDGTLNVKNDIILETYEDAICAMNPSGDLRRILLVSDAGNTVLGSGGYEYEDGNTNIYGKDVRIYSASAGKVGYKPYYCAGDSLTLTIYTAGFVTSGGKSIRFLVPFAKPIIGNPTVTISSVSGITIRQGGQYTHGSNSTTAVKPASYETIGDTDWNGIQIVANMTDTTNVQNNDALGVYWNGTITFS